MCFLSFYNREKRFQDYLNGELSEEEIMAQTGKDNIVA